VLVERKQRVPEARDRERVAVADLREHRLAGVDELVRVVGAVTEVRVARLRDAVLAVGDGAHRRGADVEGDDPGHGG
jgi:hypothetical protein